MKKKLLSLLLVIAVMMTSVSMGFGALTAFAAPAGGGVEAINAFSLTGQTGITGTDFSTSITIKSKVSGCQIKVNSVTASIRYTANDTGGLNTVNVDSSVNGEVIDTSGETYSVTGTIGAGLAGLIRYECNYDLIDNNNGVVYKGMTGYGYGYVSANGRQTGPVGSNSGRPTTPGDRYELSSFDEISTVYVMPGAISKGSKQTTTSSFGSGAKSGTVDFAITGNAPSTLTVRQLHWNSVEAHKSSEDSTTWFQMDTIANGYYEFTLVATRDTASSDPVTETWKTIKMYQRDDASRDKALAKFNTLLGEGREKSYYTADSWNKYLTELDKTALVGMATPGPNYGFRRACELADAYAAGTNLDNAKSGLSPLPADYTAMNNAVNAFGAIMDSTVEVKTYTEGATALGSETIRLYTQDSVNEALAWYSSTVKSDLLKCDQLTVDGYTEQVIWWTNNLEKTPAVYTYIENAIAEYEKEIPSHRTPATWDPYEGAINSAKNLSPDLTADRQGEINTILGTILSTRQNLKYVQANTDNLQSQITGAEVVYQENSAGRLITQAAGFNEAWIEFEAAYAEANSVKDYTIDKQTAVDNAANRLAVAIKNLSNYRLLDTSELSAVLALTPQYDASKYTTDSYNTWNTLRVEGYSFVRKAGASYTGTDRKTYNDLDEMNRLINYIRSALNSLEKVKADFTELNKTVASFYAWENIEYYKPEVVENIKEIIASIDYGAPFDEQNKVNDIDANLKAALANLTEENYRDADYTDVYKAIEEANALDRSKYTNFSSVDEAVSAVVENKKIDEQAVVDGYAAAIRDAIKNLQFKPADYTEVNNAITEAGNLPNKEWYANYYRVQEIVAGIDWNLTVDKQDIVNGYAAAIREAIKEENLVLAEADYSGVSAAIKAAEDIKPLSDFTDEYVAELDSAISSVVAGYTKDRQAEVDAMADAIWAVVNKSTENLRPADYTKVNVAIAYAEGFKESEYDNYQIVKDAIAAIDWNLNCRQTVQMQAQINAIYAAVEALELLPADYSELDKVIEDAEYACENGDYPYTEASKQAVYDEINKVDRTLDIQHQADVDAYIPLIQAAVDKLTYIRADYTAVDEQIAIYRELERDLYASLLEIDTYVGAIDMNITIDRQTEVDTIAEELEEMLGSLEYGEADYSAVNDAVMTFEGMNKDFYYEEDVKAVEDAIEAVVPGYTRERQADVDKMADDIIAALEILRTKMKPADLTALRNAVDAANARVEEMDTPEYDIDLTTYYVLVSYLDSAEIYNENTKIDQQASIDELTAQIIEATANLEYVFEIDLSGTDLIIDEENHYIYGFEEGVMSSDARDLIKFVGAAELKIYETGNGFGTGTMIQFVSTKDGSILGTYTVLVFGDANGDAVVDTFDLAYLIEVVNTGDVPELEIIKVLDLFKDGSLDAMDLSVMTSLANMDATLRQDGTMGTY